MRRKNRWYVYPILAAIIGFIVFFAMYDLEIPKQTVEKEIRYDQLQK